MGRDTIDAIKRYFVQTNSAGNKYLSTGQRDKTMEHLSCFVPGLLALASTNEDLMKNQNENEILTLAEELAEACHKSYLASKTHLGPDTFSFTGTSNSNLEGTALSPKSLLRPEFVESCFYLYRITKKDVYREWAWDYALAIETFAKTDSGFSGLKDVNDVGSFDGTQQTFLIAETFKYMYLIFSDDEVVSLDKFVFNTEAHPLRVFQ